MLIVCKNHIGHRGLGSTSNCLQIRIVTAPAVVFLLGIIEILGFIKASNTRILNPDLDTPPERYGLTSVVRLFHIKGALCIIPLSFRQSHRAYLAALLAY